MQSNGVSIKMESIVSWKARTVCLFVINPELYLTKYYKLVTTEVQRNVLTRCESFSIKLQIINLFRIGKTWKNLCLISAMK